MLREPATQPATLSGSLSAQAGPWFERASNSLHVMDRHLVAEHVAALLVAQLQEALRKRSHAVLLPSAGRTLQETYAVLHSSYRAAVEWRRVVCVQMDEYDGLGYADPQSFASQLRRELVEPLAMGRFIHFFDRHGIALCSLDAYEEQLRDLGGIDCAVHGVGLNGHIAFNEPHASSQRSTRCVHLEASTRTANGVSFARGVTLGLDILGQARSSTIVMLGSAKRSACEALLYGAPGPHNPVAHLQASHNVSIYVDPQAAPRIYPADSCAS